MADRNERVILTADTGQFNTAMARAAATAKGLEVALDDLDGTQVDTQSSTEGLGKETDGLGASQKRTTKTTKEFTLEVALAEERSRRLRTELRQQAKAQLDLADGIKQSNDEVRSAGPEIDRFSGRLRLLADVALTIGPALVPIGAAVVPALSAMTLGLGVTVAAVGTAALAFTGLGKALESLNDYQLEPTADNLQAMRVEMEKLGPSGANFVRFLDEVAPQFVDLQMAARDGLLPGVEEGITNLLPLLPQVRDIVTQVAEAMGRLSADAGASLAGSEFEDFFRYLQTDAAPTLEQLGRTLGNFGEGFANILVNLAPATRDFGDGLEGLSERFAAFSRGLGDNAEFAEFLAYVRQSGPQVVDLLGSVVDAFVGLAQAAAPVGSALLPVLTNIVDAFAAIAKSPIGAPLITAAAALAAFNRASSAGGALMSALSTNLDRVGISADRTSGSLGKIGAAAKVAGGALAALAVVDSLQTQFEGLDTGLNGVTSQLLNLSSSGAPAKLGGEFDNLGESFRRLTDANYAQKFQDSIYDSFSFLGSDSRVDEATAQFEAIDNALANIAAQGGAPAAQEAFAALAQSMGLSSSESSKLLGMLPQYQDALAGSENASRLAADSAEQLGDGFRSAASGAQQFSAALAGLNGWLDKRAAIRGYEESLQGLAKGLRNGFKREDAENLDNTARGILQVAQAIKSPELREDFLAKARSSLSSLAKNSGPEARAEIQRVIGKMDELGLTRPTPKVRLDGGAAEAQAGRIRGELNELDRQRANPKAGLDDGAFTGTLRRTRSSLTDLDQASATPTVKANTGSALSSIQGVFGALRGLDGQTATVTTYFDKVTRFFTGPKSAEGNFFPANTFANGGLDRANAHEPELYRGGVTRIWGEPETKGEAYIPLANDHRRPRAKSILEATAAEMNGSVQWFATGGMSASADYYSRTSPTARLAADADFAGRKMREFGMGVERGERGLKAELKARQRLLERETEAAEKRMNTLQEELQETKELRKSLRDSVAGNFTTDLFGGLDLMDAAKRGDLGDITAVAEAYAKRTGATDQTTEQQVQAYLESLSGADRARYEAMARSGQLNRDTRDATAFESALEQLRKLGLDGDAYQSLATSGDLNAAQYYATLSRAEIDRFEQQVARNQQAAMSVGNTAGNAEYLREIKQQTRAFQEARDEYRETRRENNEANRRIERRLEQLEKRAEKAPKETGREVGKAINDASNGRG